MRKLGAWTLVCSVTLALAAPAAAFPQGGGAGGAPAAEHSGAAAAKPAAQSVGKIDKVKGGQTVAEIFQGRAKLSGKDVAVRGKVVKVSTGVMGKTWLHLQDGSGAAGTNDLTVTTAGQAAVGDVVVARGKLSTDKDFGYGYKYDVILEDAKVSKE